MRVRDCKKCRADIFKAAKDEYLNHEFDIFEDSARSLAIYAVCGVLTAMIRKGRTPKYITELYDDMVNVFNTDSFFGKTVTMTDIMNALSKDYGIDWERIQPKLETREEFLYSMRGK
jgi:hypothetical protein